MLNAFPVQAFKTFSQTLVADASNLIGFDKGVHEAAENQSIVIRTPDGRAATLTLHHTCKGPAGVEFWQFQHDTHKHLKAIIFND